VAIASAAAAAQITTLAPFEKLPPYGNNTLPAGVTPRLVPNVNGLTVNMLEAGTQGLSSPRGRGVMHERGFRRAK
jgi:hypothetical protein